MNLATESTELILGYGVGLLLEAETLVELGFVPREEPTSKISVNSVAQDLNFNRLT